MHGFEEVRRKCVPEVDHRRVAVPHMSESRLLTSSRFIGYLRYGLRWALALRDGHDMKYVLARVFGRID
jgi:hypothetical protein